jgi:hypothetical protein
MCAARAGVATYVGVHRLKAELTRHVDGVVEEDTRQRHIENVVR